TRPNLPQEVITAFDATRTYARYEQLIADEEANQLPGWENRVEQYTFMRDNNIEIAEWRRNAAFELYVYKGTLDNMPDGDAKTTAQIRFDTMKAAIVNDDWRTYLQERERVLKDDTTMEQNEKDVQLWSIDFRLKYDIKPDPGNFSSENWKDTLIYMTENEKRSYNDEMEKPLPDRDPTILETLNTEALIDMYRLENNIQVFTQPDSYDNSQSYTDEVTLWSAFQNSILLLPVISVLIIVVAGGMISSEFSAGTIKFLLINPVKRWKILVAKYITVLSVAIIMLLIFYIFNAILSGIYFGFKDMGAPYLYVTGGKVQAGSSFLFVAQKYLLSSLGLLTMATFAFAISSLVRNTALSVGLGVFLLLSGSGAVLMLGSTFHMDWARYILFANTDINAITTETTPFLGQTVSFALIVTAIYMVVFFLIAWDGFMRRDIK
ncbi:MAG: ABC transporter permease, partial [Clostridiales bacterium]|nr:ABC transporter permease [Clostridiales bacterium]